MLPATIFRVAAPASPRRNLGKTLVQIVVMWTVALAVLPWLIGRVADAAGIARFRFEGQLATAIVMFAVVSAANLWAGVEMAWHGSGTPLPLDAPRRLVVRGPYRYVRNPMAMGGVGQGLAVGLGMGCWPVLAYAAGGGVLWNFALRPPEERDLLRRFGEEYGRYRDRVRCWVPRLTAYRPPALPGVAATAGGGGCGRSAPPTPPAAPE